MRHPRVGVRAAAAQGMRSVSRSVRSIRTAAVDAGVAAPLVALLDDPAPLVQAAASAALCNLVLDFAPMKAEVIQLGGIAKLANLAKHLTAGESGRLHAVWALKNIAYNAPAATKDQTISALGWPAIRGMIEADGNPAIQEQMLNLLRNLVCGAEGDISVMFSGYNAAFGPSARGSATPGGAMLDMLVRYMDGADPELAHQVCPPFCFLTLLLTSLLFFESGAVHGRQCGDGDRAAQERVDGAPAAAGHAACAHGTFFHFIHCNACSHNILQK
ncbi:armadillo-type protein, partial [Blastocladiella britannica]